MSPRFPSARAAWCSTRRSTAYAYGTLRPRRDDDVHIESVDFGETARFGFDDAMAFDGKLDLVKAAIHRLSPREEGGGGFDLFLHSNAPPGSGLGSSSTMMVALIGLLKEFRSVPLTDYEVAQIAYEVERIDLGLKGGLQDQYAATFGGFNFLELHADRVIVNPLRIPDDTIMELEHNLLLAYTGRTRQGDHIIEDQTTRFEDARRRDRGAARAEGAGRRHEERAAAAAASTTSASCSIRPGRRRSGCPTGSPASYIDEMYAEAMKAAPLGGKVTGAGGGGYMLFYCRYDRKHRVADRLEELGAKVTEFAFEHDGAAHVEGR